MAKITRSGFIKKTSAGAVAVGALSVVPSAAHAAQKPVSLLDRSEHLAAAEPFVVYVRNAAAGEMVLLHGDQEVIHTDRDLAARLWRVAAGRHTAAVKAAKRSVR